MRRIINHKLGFTLIEILVVIAIIGILFTIGLTSYLTAQKQTRDTRRKTDLLAIQQALETYRSEYGAYPDLASWEGALKPTFISVIPQDPKAGSYRYVPLGAVQISAYSLCATLEIAPDTPVLTNCAYPENYEVLSP